MNSLSIDLSKHPWSIRKLCVRIVCMALIPKVRNTKMQNVGGSYKKAHRIVLYIQLSADKKIKIIRIKPVC